MAFFAALIHRAALHRSWLALAVLPAVVAVHLAGTVPGSAAQAVMQATPLPWLYQFNFLKYLLIVLPGSFFGAWLIQIAQASAAARAAQNDAQSTAQPTAQTPPQPARTEPALALCSVAVVVLCLTLLYTRQVTLALLTCTALLALAGGLARSHSAALRCMLAASAGWLLLGLLIEPLQGGIRKDPATVSYFAVTTGLSGLLLVALLTMPATRAFTWCRDRLAEVGQNPLVGYTVGALVLLPALKLSGLYPLWAGLTASPAQGLMRGVMFTAAVAALTIAMTRRGWLWRA